MGHGGIVGRILLLIGQRQSLGRGQKIGLELGCTVYGVDLEGKGFKHNIVLGKLN